MSEYEERADELEHEAEDMEERSDRLEDEIGDAREDWEHKKTDPGVPGATDDED
jgi:predicted  nucleic acid-binding Zn-ribbon protein